MRSCMDHSFLKSDPFLAVTQWFPNLRKTAMLFTHEKHQLG
ncbi:hypothetical protein J2858_000904 [Neorhizobium galegae]|nr:hypothetical protein [Neorhizobium galegae]